jgi:hypothetical protein
MERLDVFRLIVQMTNHNGKRRGGPSIESFGVGASSGRRGLGEGYRSEDREGSLWMCWRHRCVDGEQVQLGTENTYTLGLGTAVQL